MAQYLLNKFPELVDIRQRNNAGFSPLHAACERGHFDVVCWLVRRLPVLDLNASSLDHVSPFRVAFRTLCLQASAQGIHVQEALHALAEMGGPSGERQWDCMKLLMLNGGGKDAGATMCPCVPHDEINEQMGDLFFPPPTQQNLIWEFRNFVSSKVAAYARYLYFCVCVQRRPDLEWLDRDAYLFARLHVRDFLVGPEFDTAFGDWIAFLDDFAGYREGARVFGLKWREKKLQDDWTNILE